MPALNTVNVVEYASGTVQQIISYKNTKEDVNKAEAMFNSMAVENGMDPSDLEDCLMDGLYEQGDYQLFLVHSTPVME